MVAETSTLRRSALAPRHGNLKGDRTRQNGGLIVSSSTNGLAAVRGSKPTAAESGKDSLPRPGQQHTNFGPNSNSPIIETEGHTMPRPPMVDSSSSRGGTHHNNRLPPQQQRLTIAPPQDTLKPVRRRSDPLGQEQALFEQRLCDDKFGVAVRKINQYGKASLRYVRCIRLDDRSLSDSNHNGNRSVSSRSASSRGRWQRNNSNRSVPSTTGTTEKSQRALIWGKKNHVQIPLGRFVAVRKGKTTDRARRNQCPGSRILSILTDDAQLHLDIEAPTQMDRDKFARAFARFLQIPLDGSDDTVSVQSAEVNSSNKTAISRDSETERWSAPGDVDGKRLVRKSNAVAVSPSTATDRENTVSWPPPLPPSSDHRVRGGSMRSSSNPSSHPSSSEVPGSSSERPSSSGAMVSLIAGSSGHPAVETNNDEDGSVVSSITGHGYDQELVEELHHALNDLRAELDESRAEAARAVKVAEQAIQSAEKSSSQEWQNTVTHKAAEAAALAQKRSAEAMAKQRLAEERLEGERRTAAFWKKQAEVAEEEAGKLQTRAAAAEVQRSAIEERLESERHMTASQVAAINARVVASEARNRDALEAALERNRALEFELNSTRRALESKQEEIETTDSSTSGRKKKGFGRKKKSSETKSLLSGSASSSSSSPAPDSPNQVVLSSEQVKSVYADMAQMRQQFELLRRATSDELMQLPLDSRLWADQIAHTVSSSQTELNRLRSRLASESASRRKLLHEVQDLRGCARVYCRPRPSTRKSSSRIVSLPSQDTLVLHRERLSSNDETVGPKSFEFDRVFELDSVQQDVYGEVEEVCLGALDGYSVCLVAYGQSGCGKTHTMLGDISVTEETVEFVEHGLHLRAMKQLFSIANHRSDRYDDKFTLTIVEVNDERLCDLLAGTDIAESRGEIIMAENKSRRKSHKLDGDETSSGKQTKLEIRSNTHGDTVVQGSLSVTVESFEELCAIWADCFAVRAQRLFEQGIDMENYERSSHVIATVQVVSSNIATGMGSLGKLQFVDLAGADLIPREEPKVADDALLPDVGGCSNWQFANRSLEILEEVVEARAQFARSVPYRNSTLTHLLRDSLESDTKVVLFACLSSEEDDAQETAATLRFASRMRRVNVGKATKHTLSPP